jgi:hypothetical protein
LLALAGNAPQVILDAAWKEAEETAPPNNFVLNVAAPLARQKGVTRRIDTARMLTTQEANKILRRNRRNLAIGRALIILMYGLRALSFVISVAFWILTAFLLVSILKSNSRRRW